MSRNAIHAGSRILATRGNLREAAEHAGREMTIGMQHVHVIAAHGQVDGTVDTDRDLIAKIKIGRIDEAAALSRKDPYRA